MSGPPSGEAHDEATADTRRSDPSQLGKSEKRSSRDSDSTALDIFRGRFVKLVMIAGFAVVAVSFGWLIWQVVDSPKVDHWLLELIKEHYAAVIGVPLAIAASLVVVSVLRIVHKGTIKFEGLGFKFEGAAGQMVFWMLSFLTIVGAIKLLW